MAHSFKAIVLVAMIAGCWASQVAAQAQDATTQAADYSKHKKHEKYEHHDKHYGHDKPYGYEYGPEYGHEHDYGYYAPDGPDGLPRSMHIDLELDDDLYYLDYDDTGYVTVRDAYCDAKGPDGSYSYTSEPAEVPTSVSPILAWYESGQYCAEPIKTECYGQPAMIVDINVYAGPVPGWIDAAGATACDKDLSHLSDTSPWALESLGVIKQLLANVKIPRSRDLVTVKSSGYYNELDGTVCGMAYVYQGVGFYGSDEAVPWLDAFTRTTDPETPPVYGYFGSVNYVSSFYSADGLSVPSLFGGKRSNVAAKKIISSEEIKAACELYRGSLPVLEYGKVDIDMSRYTAEQLEDILEGLTAENTDYTKQIAAGRQKKLATMKKAKEQGKLGKTELKKGTDAKKSTDAKEP